MSSEVTPELRRLIIDAVRAAERDMSPDLSVSDLAEFVGISDKHFQRCFKQVIGESPKSYVRRVRLQSSAYLLKWSDLSITNIAMQSGFSTHAGYTKAFIKAYSMTPQEFRNAQGVVPYLSARDPEGDAFDSNELVANGLTVRIEKQPSYRVAAMRHVGPTESMASVWPKMVAWARENKLINKDTVVLGIHNDYWDANAEDRYRYDAAIVVPETFNGDDRVNTFTLPSGDVAKTEFSGSLYQADLTWRRFTDQWLPVSGYQLRFPFAYDRYPVKLVTGGLLEGILRTLTGIRATLCLPVKR